MAVDSYINSSGGESSRRLVVLIIFLKMGVLCQNRHHLRYVSVPCFFKAEAILSVLYTTSEGD